MPRIITQEKRINMRIEATDFGGPPFAKTLPVYQVSLNNSNLLGRLQHISSPIPADKTQCPEMSSLVPPTGHVTIGNFIHLHPCLKLVLYLGYTKFPSPPNKHTVSTCSSISLEFGNPRQLQAGYGDKMDIVGAVGDAQRASARPQPRQRGILPNPCRSMRLQCGVHT